MAYSKYPKQLRVGLIEKLIHKIIKLNLCLRKVFLNYFSGTLYVNVTTLIHSGTKKTSGCGQILYAIFVFQFYFKIQRKMKSNSFCTISKSTTYIFQLPFKYSLAPSLPKLIHEYQNYNYFVLYNIRLSHTLSIREAECYRE